MNRLFIGLYLDEDEDSSEKVTASSFFMRSATGKHC